LEPHEFTRAHRSPERGDEARVEPILALIARSIAGTVGLLELPQLRVLVLLARDGAKSVSELSVHMKMPTRRMFGLLDAMEASGWVTSGSRARGVDEKIAISQQGQNVVAAITARRQDEIDETLERMSDEDRDGLARAFKSFVTAAGEMTADRTTRDVVPALRVARDS
jgi:DNA-binding MarR family transcriptional regulator